MARIISLLLIAGFAQLVAAQEAKSTVVQTAKEEVVPAKEAVATGLRGGISKEESAASVIATAETDDKWDAAPKVQEGARKATGMLLGVPAFLLFIMLVAKRNGGFYPAGCVCFFILLIFVYTMIKSPYGYFQP